MALYVKENGAYREVTLEDIYTHLEGHPEQILQTVQLITSQGPDQYVPSYALAATLSKTLVHATVKTWLPAVKDANSGLHNEVSVGGSATIGKPRYRFVNTPDQAMSPQPIELIQIEGSRVFSSYQSPSLAPETPDLKDVANAALDYLFEHNYSIKISTSDPIFRKEQISDAVKNFNFILEASTRFPMAQVHPFAFLLPLLPGGVPSAVASTIENFQVQLELTDGLDLQLVRNLMAASGVASENLLATKVEVTDLSEFYLNIDEWLKEFGEELKGVASRLKNNQATDWWLDGERFKSSVPLRRQDLKGTTVKVVEHLVVPGLAPPPPTVFGEILDHQMPLVLSLSDLHIGQGEPVDNADDIYNQLDAAFIQMLNGWSAKVNQYRFEKGANPAYLVLHGDILDFWSADMKPDQNATGGWEVSAEINQTSGKAEITPQQAEERMNSILIAHKSFFDRITVWVNESNFNFVIYVCGNHDDYLTRFGLGEKLAKRLHPQRSAFAAKTAYFPQLRAIIEHGHRGDQFNAYNPSGDNLQTLGGSIGELIVMMMVNPAERGGPCFISQLASVPGTDVFQSHGLDPDRMANMQKIYDRFARSRLVHPELYEAYMGSIDNLDNGGMEDVVADCAGRELVRANQSAADDANVAKLDDDVEKLKGIWLSSEFQTFLKRWIARPLSPAIPPTVQAWAVNKAFAANHSKRLGFEKQTGLNGNKMMKVHVVGHTHKPSATDPEITGNLVAAQHVNTGTGQDAWLADDTWGWDPSETGHIGNVRWSKDSLKHVPRSQYCLIYLGSDNGRIRIFVEANKFRELQAGDPRNVKTSTISGGLWPSPANKLDL